MFSVSQLAAVSPDATFIDRDDGDLERDACKLSTPCYLFHHNAKRLSFPLPLPAKGRTTIIVLLQNRNPCAFFQIEYAKISQKLDSTHGGYACFGVTTK